MTQARILVVDDDSLVALNLQHQLEYLGYTVAAVASSGGEAIAEAEAGEPDLVLMDIKLGGRMDGVETADEIRSRLDIPVVYLTGYSDEHTLDRVKATEPFGYLLKPFEARDLRVAIEMALYKHAAEQRLREYAATLEVRNRELDAFAQTVAHDLKDALIAGQDTVEGECEGLERRFRRNSCKTMGYGAAFMIAALHAHMVKGSTIGHIDL